MLWRLPQHGESKPPEPESSWYQGCHPPAFPLPKSKSLLCSFFKAQGAFSTTKLSHCTGPQGLLPPLIVHVMDATCVTGPC